MKRCECMNLKTTIACYWVIVNSNGRILYSWGGGKGALVSIASNSIASATVGTAPELIAPPPDGWFLRKARRDIDLFAKKSENKYLSYEILTLSSSLRLFLLNQIVTYLGLKSAFCISSNTLGATYVNLQ